MEVDLVEGGEHRLQLAHEDAGEEGGEEHAEEEEEEDALAHGENAPEPHGGVDGGDSRC